MNRTLTLVSIVLIAIALMAQTGAVPAYNTGPPPKRTKLAPLLPPDQLWHENSQYSFQRHAYELARKIPVVLYQQPCYCYCDRIGHNSLHSCYESTHAANCGACLKELYYTYQMNEQGKSPREIRNGIIRGDWKQIDLETTGSIK